MKTLFLCVMLCAAAALAGCSGESTQTPRPATPTAIATTPTMAPVTTLSPGDNAKLPPGHEFFVETGCWQCDGGPTALFRVYTSGDGAPSIDQVATELPGVYFGSMMSVYGTLWTQMAPDGFRACSECFPDGLTIYRSNDGGRSFAGVTQLNDSHEGVAVALDEDVVLHALGTYRTLQDPLVPPDDALSPVALSGGKLGWRTTTMDEVIDATGATVIAIAADREIWKVSPLPNAPDSGFVIHSRSRRDNRYFLSRVVEGVIASDLVVESGSITNLIAVGVSQAQPLIVGNILFDNPLSTSPILIDMQAGQMHQITSPFSSPPFAGERNHIIGVR